MIPDWLPDMVHLSGTDLADNYRQLYEIYCRDFSNLDGLAVDGCQVIVNEKIDHAFGDLQYTHGFTHIVTKGNGQRIIDFERATRLPWVRAVIENYGQPEVTAFWVLTPKGPSVVLWLVEQDFTVFLRDPDIQTYTEVIPSDGSRIIVSAYHLDHNGKRKMQRQFGNAIRIIQ